MHRAHLILTALAVSAGSLAAQQSGTLEVGSVAPEFALTASTRDGVQQTVKLSDFKGKTVVLAFFPKVRTRGCTIQMKQYRDSYGDLFHDGKDVVLLAISADPADAQASWAKDEGFPFRFLSDADGTVGKAYGAWSDQYKLDKRVLYVIGPDGRITYVADPFREVDPSAYSELGDAINQAAHAGHHGM
ncbi:MAG: peroxiredoxin [Gemmatimonadota bacterium]